jgi:hypothetical protein
MRKILVLLLTLLLAACNLPRPLPGTEPQTVTDTPGSEAGYAECAWTWASQSLPELSAEVQSALDSAGLKNATVSAVAYGENCVVATGEVDHFATMETDFHFQVEVPSLSDAAALGDTLERILTVLNAFPPDLTPGPQPGYIGVRFTSRTEELNLWFTWNLGQAALDTGLHGADLLNELQNK